MGSKALILLHFETTYAQLKETYKTKLAKKDYIGFDRPFEYAKHQEPDRNRDPNYLFYL